MKCIVESERLGDLRQTEFLSPEQIDGHGQTVPTPELGWRFPGPLPKSAAERVGVEAALSCDGGWSPMFR